VSSNFDLVRSIYAEWERGDFSVAEWAHPDMEYVHTDGPDPGRWTGLADVTKGLRDFLSAWSDWWTSAEEFRELDDGRVAVLNRYGGRGKTSGVEVGQTGASGAAVFRVQGGKVTSIVIYFSRDRALADLGLTPECDALSARFRPARRGDSTGHAHDQGRAPRQ
jgi:ketosteroid isomerase-like protein